MLSHRMITTMRPIVERTPLANQVLWGIQRSRAQRSLGDVPPLEVDAGRLRHVTRADLAAALACPGPDCRGLHDRLDTLKELTSSGGVNMGDRWALAHLVLRWRPKRVLEIGTHVGASLATIALALEEAGRGTVDTVDIVDVNDPVTRAWEEYDAERSPQALLQELGVEDRARFVTSHSLEHLQSTRKRYDMVFLDGDHAAATVYQEIPEVLKRLSQGGTVMMHDFFPEARPLWSNGRIIPGPWLAVDRLQREGAALEPLPLGDLPWPTKYGSNRTSLSLVTRSAGPDGEQGPR